MRLKSILIGLLASVAAMPGVAQASEDSGCPASKAIVEQVGHCVETPGGIVLATTAERASALAAIGVAGEARFLRHFERATPRYALVEGEGGLDPSINTALEAAGYAWRMPWLTPAAYVEQISAASRRTVEARAQANGLSAEQTERMLATVMDAQKPRLAPEAVAKRESGVVPHELGHGWYIRGWWPKQPERPRDAPPRYGGPGPDWMDELAAVLMEDDVLADERRSGFATRLAGEADARARLLDLETYLTQEHPALRSVPAAARPGPGEGPRVMVMSSEESRAIADQGIVFYLQSRLFADYLIERAGPSRAFVSAADVFAAGGATADWLARHGAALGIASDIEALSADWREWIEQRHAAPAV